MRTLLAALLLLALSTTAGAWTEAPPQSIESCSAQTPWGLPTNPTNPSHLQMICRKAYVLASDTSAKIPLWVAWTLTPAHAAGCVPRSNAFAADSSLPVGSRAELADYAHSGYDIGHLANDADMSWDPVVEHESFILSNMSPQLPGLNRGIWKVLETWERAWAWGRGHALTIYAGNVYTPGHSAVIGPNRVTVPDQLYKILIDNTTHEVQAYVFPHREGQGTDLRPLLSSVAAVEQLTGTVFPLPPNTDKTLTATAPWSGDLSSLAAAKKAQCKS